MEEIVTVDGKQFKLTTDRPLTALEKSQTIAQIRAQTGCSSCHQPKTMSTGFGDMYDMTSDTISVCTTAVKQSGQAITLASAPSGAIGPYHVRFFRMPGTSATNALSFTELNTMQVVAEGSSTSTSFTLYDTDLVAASGNNTAGTPTTDATGALLGATTGSTQALTVGYVRLFTTVYDSCPTGYQSCVSWCDVALGCIAPTCNFTVT